ncbi:MAG TPA: glycosyltransferase [Ohtaekwangia sp.]|nr:glycosyltransferase [Ohtaekwangia sp.]
MDESPLKLKDLVCFSHLRWNFVYQRPQHLISRFTKCFRVFFIEEPIYQADSDHLEINTSSKNVIVVVPYLLENSQRADVNLRLQNLLDGLFSSQKITNYLFWYDTPLALPFTSHFHPAFVIYDCIREVSLFKAAQDTLTSLENELLAKADVVFAGGQSLFEVKKKQHPRTFLFPSSIDRDHFLQARHIKFDPPDQDAIPHPRLGYFGIIDERMDIDLLEMVSRLRPNWHFVMVGPVVGIDAGSLPNFHNIHYPGMKAYDELPHYISGWDIAIIPFVHNESTRFICPSKTQEYLAAGKPTVCTPINDVIRPYGNKGLVRIAGTPDEFVRVCEEELNRDDRSDLLERVDDFISHSSWDKTWSEMMSIIGTSLVGIPQTENIRTKGYV